MKKHSTKHRIKRVRVYEKNLMSLNTFISRNSMSRSTYYQLRRAGRGPKEIRIGRAIFISYHEERRWTQRMSEDPPSEDDLITIEI
jgi:predicted DNA-binding transcriptional regulator AlpA